MPTVKELRAEAKRRGLKGYSKLRKAQLESLLGTKSKAQVKTKKAATKRKPVKRTSRKQTSTDRDYQLAPEVAQAWREYAKKVKAADERRAKKLAKKEAPIQRRHVASGRKAPPVPAKNHQYEVMTGNDGAQWQSLPTKNGVFRWNRYKSGNAELAGIVKDAERLADKASILKTTVIPKKKTSSKNNLVVFDFDRDVSDQPRFFPVVRAGMNLKPDQEVLWGQWYYDAQDMAERNKAYSNYYIHDKLFMGSIEKWSELKEDAYEFRGDMVTGSGADPIYVYDYSKDVMFTGEG